MWLCGFCFAIKGLYRCNTHTLHPHLAILSMDSDLGKDIDTPSGDESALSSALNFEERE